MFKRLKALQYWKAMPKPGYVAVTISEDTYMLLKKVFEKHEKYLRVRHNIRSISALVEFAVRYFVQTTFPTSFEEWLQEVAPEAEKSEKG